MNISRFILSLLVFIACFNTAFAQSVSAPNVSFVGNDCDEIKFQVEDYDLSIFTYEAKLNGNSVSLEPDGTFTLTSPDRDVEYELSVSCENSAGDVSTAGTAQGKLRKAVEQPVIVASTLACDAPVVFTIDNYDSGLTYTWTLNTGTGSASAEEYTVSSPVRFWV